MNKSKEIDDAAWEWVNNLNSYSYVDAFTAGAIFGMSLVKDEVAEDLLDEMRVRDKLDQLDSLEDVEEKK